MTRLEQERQQLLKEINLWLDEQTQEWDSTLEENAFNKNVLVNQAELNHWMAKWLNTLPEEQKKTVVDMIDHLVIYIANFFHKHSNCEEIEKSIVMEARLFEPSLSSFDELPSVDFYRLQYIEQKFRSRYPLYALVEGGLAGTGHPLLLAIDFPALMSINLKMLHYVASAYGYSLKDPYEQIVLLKVLHAATLPGRHKRAAWQWLIDRHIQAGQPRDLSLFGPEQSIIKEEWLETLVKQWVKAIVLYGLKKTTKKNLSLIGMVLGANMNYQWTKRVGQFASHFYRYRFLEERKEEV
ncbi:hypothetical protein GCM10010965_01860 [Caldalkalibacillus thermarum]|uniref:EcsC family protein n=1 Tax=Caldalkalibacillus thermarum TaxID=296745 RepID=UPI0016629651|nr:EcsC family protein [Caldalkalibacillus thermarum]GGK12524.1 hypothetical protein GCM10010965_01860 [Caldalkalibacillus thermarum]